MGEAAQWDVSLKWSTWRKRRTGGDLPPRTGRTLRFRPAEL